MIVSVTPNTAIDQTLFVDTFEMGRAIRATHTVQSLAGKPADASWMLGEIGLPGLALGFVAGTLGDKVEALLHAQHVKTDFTRCDGETRLNTIIVAADRPDQQATITTSTLDVKPHHMEDLTRKYEKALADATVVIMGGSLPRALPPSFYTDFVRMARERDIPVLLDAEGDNLLAGLKSSPSFIKPNQFELEALTGRKTDPDDIHSLYEAGRAVIEQYGTSPLITLGADGGLAVLPDRAYRIPALKVDVVSAAGAGDGTIAGLAGSIHLGKPIEEGLRMAFAMATSVLLQPGTAECRKEDYERFLPQIQLIPYPG